MRRMMPAVLAAVMLLVGTGWTYPPYGTGTIETGQVVPQDIHWAVPAADVLIDAGHGGIDGGTRHGDILEKDINLAIARKLYLLLRSHNVRAVLNRTGDYALSDDNRWHAARSRHRRDLSQRRGLTDEIDAALFVSIHVNWAGRGGNRGALVLHSREGRSAVLASMIQGSLNLLQGHRTLPRPASKFYLLKSVKAPSVIVETAFISDAADRAMLTSRHGQTRIAEAIAAGIIAYRCFSP
jgi:N-acetylmuramoyl-L-alanine amidase